MSTHVDRRTVALSGYPDFVVIYLGMRIWRGGMDAIYDDVPWPIGFMAFAPAVPATGPMFGAAAGSGKEFASRPVVSEDDLYGGPNA
jgi:hypothetical protein